MSENLRPWSTESLNYRPTPAELRAARGRSIPDVIAPGLDVLFVGINPSLWSGAVGLHFARPGNRFWRALHDAGVHRARPLAVRKSRAPGTEDRRDEFGEQRHGQRRRARARRLPARRQADRREGPPVPAESRGVRGHGRVSRGFRAAARTRRKAAGAACRRRDLGAAEPERPHGWLSDARPRARFPRTAPIGLRRHTHGTGEVRMSKTVITTREAPIATVQINRPDVLNALNEEVLDELVKELTALDADDAIRCIVLTGNERAFAAGAGLKGKLPPPQPASVVKRRLT